MKMDSKTLIIICLFVIGNIAISLTNQSGSGDRLEEFQNDHNASPPPTSITLDVNNQWDTMLNLRDMAVSKSGDVFVVGTGGFANLIDNHTSIFDNIEPNLTLKGLRLIFKINYER